MVISLHIVIWVGLELPRYAAAPTYMYTYYQPHFNIELDIVDILDEYVLLYISQSR